MKSLSVSVLVSFYIAAVRSSGIPLKSCCPVSHSYDLGNNKCVKGPKPNEVVELRYPEVLYKNGTPSSFNDFKIVEELIDCPDGFIVQSTENFHLYVDGTLQVPGVSTIQNKAGSFCVGSLDDSELAVRFCLSDPCLSHTHKCVRKCCPIGFALNGTSCQKHSEEFLPVFQNELGAVVDVSDFIVRGGIMHKCENSLLPTSIMDDEFHLLPSGHINRTDDPENPVTHEYCVDDFIDGNDVVRMAVVCFEPDEKEPVKIKVFAALMIVSSVFLLATFIVYAIIPEIRNIHGATIMCHCGSLATAFICLGIIQLSENLHKYAGLCRSVAVIAHFTFLSTFTWLNTMSFDIWWTLTDFRPRSRVRHSGTKIGHRFAFYSIYAWSVPLIIMVAGQIIDSEEESDVAIEGSSNKTGPGLGPANRCWFPRENITAIWWWFYGPIAIILLSNLTFFVMTAIRLRRHQRDAAFATQQQRKKKRGTLVIFSLFLLMGLTWVTEIISGITEEHNTMYSIPTDIVNILTGVFVFILFVWKKKVRRLLRKKFLPVERIIRGHEFALSFSSSRGGSTRSTASKRTIGLTMSQVSTRDTDYPETETSKLSSANHEEA